MIPTKAAREGKHVALTKCFYCGEDNELVLHKRLGDVSQLQGKVTSMNPCSKCQEFMEKGVILIGIDDAKSENGWNIPPDKGSQAAKENWMPNPYRSGDFIVMKEEALDRVINSPEMVAWAKKHRWIFIEHSALVHMGAVKEKCK